MSILCCTHLRLSILFSLTESGVTARSSRLWEMTNHLREQHPTWPIMMTRVVCKFTAVPEVVVWDHGRNNKDNVMIIWHVFIFNYVEFTQGKLRIPRDTTVNDYLCYKGVKCLGLSFTHSSLSNDWHVWFVGLCVDRSANYSSQVFHVAYLPSADHTSHDAYF